MKKIVTASRAKAACKWLSCVIFVLGVSIFEASSTVCVLPNCVIFVLGVAIFGNPAFIWDVTTIDTGIFMVFMSVLLMSSVAQWIGDSVDRLATVSLAGAWITMGGFLLSDWLGWPTGIQNTAGILMAVFSAVCMVRAWKIDARG